jgi:hypothetical protein
LRSHPLLLELGGAFGQVRLHLVAQRGMALVALPPVFEASDPHGDDSILRILCLFYDDRTRPVREKFEKLEA